MFEVGDVVVCVDARTPAKAGYIGPFQLENEKMYRISGIFVDQWGSCVTLYGIEACTPNGGFLASRFAKLPPADPAFIELMRGLKAPNRVKEDV